MAIEGLKVMSESGNTDGIKSADLTKNDNITKNVMRY